MNSPDNLIPPRIEMLSTKLAGSILDFVRPCRLTCLATTRTYQPPGKPLIKICGITNVSDAELAAKAGADFIGMILWPKARRAVSVETAAKISAMAKNNGAKPVAVFVDEDFADIVRTCKNAGISIAQLHGKGARGSLHDLPNWLQAHTTPPPSPPHTRMATHAFHRAPTYAHAKEKGWVIGMLGVL
jgi:hypothetical protein